MTNTKMTRKEALTIAIAEVTNPEAVEVLAKMLEQVSKPRSKSATPSKSPARIENEVTAKALYDLAEAGKTYTGGWVMEHSNAMTPQKVVGIMKVAEELGYFTKVKEGRVISYQAN